MAFQLVVVVTTKDGVETKAMTTTTTTTKVTEVTAAMITAIMAAMTTTTTITKDGVDITRAMETTEADTDREKVGDVLSFHVKMLGWALGVRNVMTHRPLCRQLTNLSAHCFFGICLLISSLVDHYLQCGASCHPAYGS